MFRPAGFDWFQLRRCTYALSGLLKNALGTPPPPPTACHPSNPGPTRFCPANPLPPLPFAAGGYAASDGSVSGRCTTARELPGERYATPPSMAIFPDVIERPEFLVRAQERGGGSLDEKVDDRIIEELLRLQHPQVAGQDLDGVWAPLRGVQCLETLHKSTSSNHLDVALKSILSEWRPYMFCQNHIQGFGIHPSPLRLLASPLLWGDRGGGGDQFLRTSAILWRSQHEGRAGSSRLAETLNILPAYSSTGCSSLGYCD